MVNVFFKQQKFVIKKRFNDFNGFDIEKWGFMVWAHQPYAQWIGHSKPRIRYPLQHRPFPTSLISYQVLGRQLQRYDQRFFH